MKFYNLSNDHLFKKIFTKEKYLKQLLFDLFVSTVTLSIISIVFVVLYIIIGLFLVNKFAPRTFKLNK